MATSRLCTLTLGAKMAIEPVQQLHHLLSLLCVGHIALDAILAYRVAHGPTKICICIANVQQQSLELRKYLQI